MESKSFFWGMTIQPEKRYAQEVAEPFHVSKACLEPSVKKGGDGKAITSVYLESDNDEFLICSLTSTNLNENLDLNFNRGEKICIRTEGGGVIHLTGYLMESPEYDFDDMGEEEESDLEDEESETEEIGSKKQKIDVIASKKLSPLDKLLAASKKGEGKAKKPEEVTAEIKKAEKMKKILGAVANGNDSSDDDDSSDIEDDSSDDDDEMLDTTDMLGLEAEEDSDDSDDDGEEEEDSDDSEEEQPAKKAPATPKAKDHPKASPAKGAEVSAKKDKKKSKEAETPSPKSAQKDKSAVNTPAVTESGKKKKNKEQQAEKTPGKKEGEGKEAKNTPKNKENGQTNGAAAAATPGKTPKKTLKGGLVVEDIRVGTGPEVKAGKMVGMFYEGRLKSNNKQFDACKEGSKPFKFRLGKGEVIKAWDIGVEGMKVGGKRRLTCPPGLAYGVKGAPPSIPSNATLVFDVECKFVQ